jgi:hypothetical protein
MDSLGSRQIEALAINPQQPGYIIAGEIFGGIWISTDSGTSWTGPHNSGFNSANPYISSLVVDPANPDIVFAGDLYSGIYRSLDQGNTWAPFPDWKMSGLTIRAVKGLAINNSVLYAAAQGGGVFRFDRAARALMVTTPTQGEAIPAGSDYLVTWVAPPEAVKFKLSYSVDKGVTWKKLHTEPYITGSSYNWTVPILSNNKGKCLIKVIAYDEKSQKVGSDKSDVHFMIEVAKLTSPNGGGTPLVSGAATDITWRINNTKSPATKAVLSYTTNGGTTWKPIITLAEGYPPGEYSHLWLVPGVGTTPKTRCKVKVVLKNTKGITVGSDISDAYFTISPGP